MDWDGLTALTEWYLASGVQGLFAVCLSSEMYDLLDDERLRVAKHVAGVVDDVKGIADQQRRQVARNLALPQGLAALGLHGHQAAVIAGQIEAAIAGQQRFAVEVDQAIHFAAALGHGDTLLPECLTAAVVDGGDAAVGEAGEGDRLDDSRRAGATQGQGGVAGGIDP